MVVIEADIKVTAGVHTSSTATGIERTQEYISIKVDKDSSTMSYNLNCASPQPRPLGVLPRLYHLRLRPPGPPRTHLVTHESQFRTHYKSVNRGEVGIMMTTVTNRGRVPPIDVQQGQKGNNGPPGHL